MKLNGHSSSVRRIGTRGEIRGRLGLRCYSPFPSLLSSISVMDTFLLSFGFAAVLQDLGRQDDLTPRCFHE